MLFSRKIDCTFRTIVKVCGCCDKPYIDYPESFYSGNRFLLTAFSDIWDLWRKLENLHFAFKRYKMNVYGKKISEFMKELANVKR